ncbi:MAG TPA: DUF6600 domain-containing protein [Patescibacteria group bacterium]|nr:DUF6600 domain-containing protein [Patescibacteria group bacterium]
MPAKRAHGLSKRICLVLIASVASVLVCSTGGASTLYRSPGNGPVVVDDVQYLSGYGEWLDVPPYGMAWRPYVVSGWEPFYYGHWVWTSDGWAWVSYEPYGWLVFHYGYWGFHPGIGWYWVPGDTWWPARVQWYTFGNYAAWAPIPPQGVVWHDPWDPYDYNVWIVIDIDNFTREDVGRHRIVRPISREIVNRQTVVKRSPDIRNVEQVTRKKVPVVKVRERTVNVRTRTPATPPASVRADEPKLKRMVLPQAERRKVEKRAAKVKREVLVPRKSAAGQPKKSTEAKPDTPKRKVKSK